MSPETQIERILVAVARFTALVEAGEEERNKARTEYRVDRALIHDRITNHRREREQELKEINASIAEIREQLAGGTATRRFIVVAIGASAGIATVISVIATLLTASH